MDEELWNCCDDSEKMMKYLLGVPDVPPLYVDPDPWDHAKRVATKRKLRLFVAADCGVSYGFDWIKDATWKEWEYGEISELEKKKLQTPEGDAYATCAYSYAIEPHCIWIPVLIRDIFGNPFKTFQVPIQLEPGYFTREMVVLGYGEVYRSEWLTPTVVDLATRIYDNREFNLMPILGDAIEDTGCNISQVMDHCRSQIPGEAPNRPRHVRGCWVVDMLLRKDQGNQE